MRDLDLKSLRLFACVLDHGNIRQAAAELHTEPSAISKRIAQLEAALGTPLLVRGRRGVQATPAGLALLEHTRTLQFTLERLEADMAAFQGGVRGHVRLVASASAIAQSLLDDVAAFMREPAHRLIRVDIEEHLSRDVVRMVREGGASVGVCWDSIGFEGLQHRAYRCDDLALAVHADHPLAGRERVCLADTFDHEHVGLPPATAVHTMLRRAAAQAGRSLNYRVIVSSFDAALRVVAANLGLSVIPRQICQVHAHRDGRLRVIALSDAWAQRRFGVCFRDFGDLPPAARRMVEFLSERAREAQA